MLPFFRVIHVNFGGDFCIYKNYPHFLCGKKVIHVNFGGKPKVIHVNFGGKVRQNPREVWWTNLYYIPISFKYRYYSATTKKKKK